MVRRIGHKIGVGFGLGHNLGVGHRVGWTQGKGGTVGCLGTRYGWGTGQVVGSLGTSRDGTQGRWWGCL